MKIQVNRVRLRISLIALLVCCVVAGCRTWQVDRVFTTIGRPVPKAAFVWRSGQTIYVHPDPVKVKTKAEFVYWTCYERFEIEYKTSAFSTPQCDTQAGAGGLYTCRSETFDVEKVKRIRYTIRVFPVSGPPVVWDPEIEVLE